MIHYTTRLGYSTFIVQASLIANVDDDYKMLVVQNTGASLTVVNYTPRVISYASRMIHYTTREHL